MISSPNRLLEDFISVPHIMESMKFCCVSVPKIQIAPSDEAACHGY